TARTPARVLTLTSRSASPFTTQATAAPQEPVPEDAVSPTPRSQKRTAISRREITFTNSTFVRRGNSSFLSISRPSLCQSTAAKSPTNNVQWGLPMEVTETGRTPLWVRRGNPTTGGGNPPALKGILGGSNSGRPMPTRKTHEPFPELIRSSVFTPAAVSIERRRLPFFRPARSTPAQRMPLPDISASLPSALKNRARASWLLERGGSKTMKPSAPTPVWRSSISRASGASERGSPRPEVTIKSLPRPLNFAKGICIISVTTAAGAGSVWVLTVPLPLAFRSPAGDRLPRVLRLEKFPLSAFRIL